MAHIGVPIKLLHEAQGHVVTCELMNGEVIYRDLDPDLHLFDFLIFF